MFWTRPTVTLGWTKKKVGTACAVPAHESLWADSWWAQHSPLAIVTGNCICWRPRVIQWWNQGCSFYLSLFKRKKKKKTFNCQCLAVAVFLAVVVHVLRYKLFLLIKLLFHNFFFWNSYSKFCVMLRRGFIGIWD